MAGLLTQIYVNYQGHRFVLQSKGAPGELRLLTCDASVAATLGFVAEPGLGFIGTVGQSDETEVFQETWWGILHGETVLIWSMSDDVYHVETERPSNARRYGFRLVEKGIWSGPVPKQDFTRVWQTREPFHIWW